MRPGLADGWLFAFRAWLKRWRGDRRVLPEWHDGYKRAFRAGWRAAMQSPRRFK